VKRMLSVVSLVPLATAPLLAMSASAADATTATATSLTPSTVKAQPQHQDYPPFECQRRYNHDEHTYQYWCRYPYYDGHHWHWYYWWLNYDPPDWSRSSHDYYPNSFKCVYRYNHHADDYQYRCSYRYYDKHHHSHSYYWWYDYDPPDWWAPQAVATS